MKVTLHPDDALFITDVQSDFLPGGSLAVQRAEEVVPLLNAYIDVARAAAIPVYTCRDWHPSDHCSFRAHGGPWPEHCVAGTPGAAFAVGLQLPPDTVVIDKATKSDAEAYSAFAGTDLAARLRNAGIRRLLVGGLTTEYCVLNTVLDALNAGFDVLLLEDAIRAVNLHAGDGEQAQRSMQNAGAVPIRLADIQREKVPHG
jgi:nicotinamidase/pyrazinamidase